MKRYNVAWVLAFTLMLVVVACGGGATSTPIAVPAATLTPEPEATATLAPTAVATPTLLPTATPKAADTPVPKDTPEPTATLVPLAPTSTPAPTAAPTPAATPEPTATLAPLAPTSTPASMAASVTIGASKDNTLYENSAGALSNGAGQHIFSGRTNGGFARRAIIAFDIASNVPPGAAINSVRLTLNLSRTQAAPQDIELRRLSCDWGEGASDASGQEGGGAVAVAGDATWIHTSYDSSQWQSPGGDFSGSPSASASVGNAGLYTWGSTDQMVADVQGWLDDPSTNFGWLLLGNEFVNQTTKRFDSKDNPTEANRPRLVIEFRTQ